MALTNRRFNVASGLCNICMTASFPVASYYAFLSCDTPGMLSNKCSLRLLSTSSCSSLRTNWSNCSGMRRMQMNLSIATSKIFCRRERKCVLPLPITQVSVCPLVTTFQSSHRLFPTMKLLLQHTNLIFHLRMQVLWQQPAIYPEGFPQTPTPWLP